MALSLPTEDDKEDLLLSCRYGDTEDVKLFVDRFGPDPLNEVRDDSGNSVLHMACGNGHLDYLLSVVSPTLLSAQNNARSTPLHWAALNSHLPVVQRLVQFPNGPGKDLIDIKNASGRTPLGEAENVGWDEGAKWLVQVMNLDDGDKEEKQADEGVEVGPEDIEVEIQDAEGKVARMKISPQGSDPSKSS
ncbi:hypothetical protein NLI96_g5297 [Meripilus lineatus]|uniref:Cytoplasmic protein n=1 Tax=Meripilus lineatus TaxID=2056292 RepID=A0AAD5V7Y7_9APHY|nr:hypothetical protein NLI96_g5297 [Physisporinus lineatus]